MLQLYGFSVVDVQNQTMSQKARRFQFWILIEIIVILCTVLTTVVYLFTRTISIEPLRLELSKLETLTNEEIDEDKQELRASNKTQDFMSSKHVEFYLPIVRTAIWPLCATYVIQGYFITTQVRQATLTY